MTWTREHAREYGRRWYHAHREEQLARAKARHKLNPEARKRSARTSRFKHVYGITYAEYDAMRLAQDYQCKICRRPETDGPKGTLFVDHDHTTGKIRGLLCAHCNSLLGHAKDDTETLRLAVLYLEVSRA